MTGTKRSPHELSSVKTKKTKLQSGPLSKGNVVGKKSRSKEAALPSPESSSDASLPDDEVSLGDDSDNQEGGVQIEQNLQSLTVDTKTHSNPKSSNGENKPTNESNSRESHIKQRALTQERKAAKPNSDSIARSKKLWEQLRRKSHVPLQERKRLVTELFEIITGRVSDFVFKHDSVRVIQCALKYANKEQRFLIADELKGQYRALAESRYAKFLLAKLVAKDNEIRDKVVPEFYGHVKKLIRHPEAAWIMDDIYRTIATSQQKARILREWYGHEFSIFQIPSESTTTAELADILKENPEKKGPIMQHLKEMTNQLVQKKTTGFTMLHDALLQYYLNCTRGSAEAGEVVEMMKGDEEGDLLKNLAFTKSGARLVCLALAWSGSKDRRAIVKVYKGVIKMLASDVYGHCVLLAAFDLIDDTVMTAKAIFPELLSREVEDSQRDQELLGMLENPAGRIPLLYLLASGIPRWLFDFDQSILREIHEIRETTSKKNPATRRLELIQACSQDLINLVRDQPTALLSSPLSCPFIVEVMFGATGDKKAALEKLAYLARDEPQLLENTQARKALKSLVDGGPFNKDSNQIEPVEPPLRFASMLYDKCQGQLSDWAKGPMSFIVVSMLESPGLDGHEKLLCDLRGHRQSIEEVARSSEGKKGNAGAAILLQKL